MPDLGRERNVRFWVVCGRISRLRDAPPRSLFGASYVDIVRSVKSWLKRRAAFGTFAMLSSLITSCGDRQPSASSAPASGMSLMVHVRPSAVACVGVKAKYTFRDFAGVEWWMDGDRWCRARSRTQPAQTWLTSDRRSSTRRLVVEGRKIALLEPTVLLKPSTEASVPVPFVICGQDIRSRVFAAENRLRSPRDLACGRTFKGPGFQLMTAGFAGPAGIMPALVTKPGKPSLGTIVYLFGGPYENLPAGLVARSTTNYLLAKWAPRATIVIPAYLGIDRVRADAGDATRARAEVDALVTKLERQGRVCVIGFSLGGAIAAASVGRHPNTHFLLTAPLATSPARFVARAMAQGRIARPITLVPSTHGGKVITISSEKAYLDYFVGSENLELAALVGPGRHSNLRIAYAGGDIPVLRSDLQPLAPKLEPNAIRELPALVGHSIETPFAAANYRPLIDSSLSQCLSPQK